MVKRGRLSTVTCKPGEITETQIEFDEPFPGTPTIVLTFNSSTSNMEYEKASLMSTMVNASGAIARVTNDGSLQIMPNIDWIAVYDG